MAVWRGMELPEMAFCTGRLNTSLATVLSASVNSFCHVKESCASSPWPTRLITFDCSESYQLFPRGDQRTGMLVNCGNGRSACASVCPRGKPAYGTWNPAAWGFPELKVEVSRERALASLRFNPTDCSFCVVRPFMSVKLFAWSHTPRLPTQAASIVRLRVSSRCSPIFHWLTRGGRPPLGSIQ